jgi:hypothetical protein
MPETDTASGPVVMVAGRVLRPAAVTTFEQDAYMVGEVRSAGLDGIGSMDPADVVARVMGSGRVPYLLAGALEEQGVPWSRAWADETARRIATTTDPDSKAALLGAVAEVIVGFFVAAGRSFAISPSASEDRMSPSATSDTHEPTRTDDSVIGEAGISASGATSSASSPTMTPA